MCTFDAGLTNGRMWSPFGNDCVVMFAWSVGEALMLSVRCALNVKLPMHTPSPMFGTYLKLRQHWRNFFLT